MAEPAPLARFRRRHLPSGLALLIAAVATWAGWWGANRPVEAPYAAGPVGGLALSPYGRGESPLGRQPERAGVAADIAVLGRITGEVRTYSALGAAALVPDLAEAARIRVMAGAWVGADTVRTRKELGALTRMARSSASVWRVLVGNEVLLRGDITPADLIGHLREVKSRVAVPVSTAEPWHIWLKYPELARETDFIAAHILPYWEGVPAGQAVAYTFRRLAELQAAFPGKRIVLSEIGWPSAGPTVGGAVASPANQALYIRGFVVEAARRGTDYILIEAFDQPWKQAVEGRAGAYWGLFDADRRPKFAFAGPVHDQPDWGYWAALTILLGVAGATLYLRARPRLAFPARLAAALLGQVAALALVWPLLTGLAWYLTVPQAGLWVFLTVALVLMLVIAAAEAAEALDVAGNGAPRRLMRLARTSTTAGERPWPRVSIHLACRNEPPDVVAETLLSLARLDYPHFEVIVVDNNTADEKLWRPVERLCHDLGERFHFHHLDNLPGFKAGALNFACTVTDPLARIVGVVDADYVVRPGWLRRLVPAFDDPRLGLMQAPQDYRDGPPGAAPLFKRLCFWEYAAFFRIGMVQRNEADAIIQHGTMTLIRRRALDRAGGWTAGHITEDAELGLRLLLRGWTSSYTTESFGCGLMPDTLAAWKTQRRRWAYGAMQILKSHGRELLPGSRRLSPGQRWQYAAGWMPWIGDALQLVFALGAIGWSLLVALWPGHFGLPPAVFLAPVLVMFGLKIVRNLWLFRMRMPCKFRDSLGAALAGLALSHTVGRAVIAGLWTAGMPFERTPKRAPADRLTAALGAAREETLMFALLGTAIALTAAMQPALSTDVRLWIAVMGCHALVYLAAIAMAWVAAGPVLRRPRAVEQVRQEPDLPHASSASAILSKSGAGVVDRTSEPLPVRQSEPGA